MRVDSNFFCTVAMPDAGDPTVAATARRYGNDAVIACYENLIDWARTADSLGFDTMWLTEHHFQHEGYEVLPNLIQFGLHLAHLTKELQSIPDGAEPSFAMRPQPPCVPRRVLLPPRAFMRVGDGSKP